MTDPTTAGLYPRIKVAIEERLQLARKATPGPWEWEPDGYSGCGQVFTRAEGLLEAGDIAAPSGDLYSRSGYRPQGDMRHIAANASPDYVIRQLEADLERLAEHEECAGAYTVSLGRLGCEEIARLVHIYGVEATP